MKSYKVLAIFVGLAIASASLPSHAEEQNGQKSTAEAQAVVKDAKKSSRKKKAQMCAECGKPESECECHGHKKDGKSSEEHEHKSH